MVGSWFVVAGRVCRCVAPISAGLWHFEIDGDKIVAQEGEFRYATLDEVKAMVSEPLPTNPDIVPDLFGAVVGYRSWFLADGLLKPAGLGPEPWVPGVNEARCASEVSGRGRHRCPGADCSCGLHAVHDPRDIPFALLSSVCGAVLAWGDLEVHAEYFRAQYARIGLLVYARVGLRIASDSRRAKRVADAAKHYGCAFMEVPSLAHLPGALVSWADGREVHDSLRPTPNKDGPTWSGGTLGDYLDGRS